MTIFRATKEHLINLKLDPTTDDIDGALISDGIQTNPYRQNGRTVEATLSAIWAALASVALFTLESGLPWDHNGTERIVANVYTVLRASCFGKSVDFLRETYGHGMGHVVDNRLHLPENRHRWVTPTAPTPSPRQPPRSRGKELHHAVRDGSKGRTVALLSGGTIDIEGADSMGYTPLLLASYFQHPSVVDALLRAGANVSATTEEGFTALGAAVRQGTLVIASMRVMAGADVKARYIDGRYALFRSVYEKNLDVATVLI